MAYLNLLPALKTTRSAAINTTIGANGLLSLYSGAPPADPSQAPTGTQLAQLPCSATFGVAAGGVLTANPIATTNASAAGTAGWARISTSAGPVAGGIVDVDVGTGGATAIINSTTITAGGAVVVVSCTLTEA